MSFDITIFTVKKDLSNEEEGIKQEKIHYVYVCRKRSDANQISNDNFNKVISRIKLRSIQNWKNKSY